MDWNFIVNRWIIPVLSVAAFIFYYLNKSQIDRWIIKSTRNPKRRKYHKFLLDGLKIRIGDWRLTIILPVILSLGLDFLISWISNVELVSYGEPVWFASLTSGFANPIMEEVLLRGIFLSIFVFLALRYSGFARYLLYGLGLVVSSYFFTISHVNPTVSHFALRFFSSLLYGVLYMRSGRNLLVPIAGHAASNWFLILKDMFLE